MRKRNRPEPAETGYTHIAYSMPEEETEDPQHRHRREANEAARRTAQPDAWISRVYESVTGLRWTCCGNEWGEDHSPWCPVVRDDELRGY